MTLVSEPVEVETREGAGGLLEPGAFTWRGERYEVTCVVCAWFDTGFVAGERTRRWYRRRHRNCYRVQADDGRVYELYLDRAGGRRDWVLRRVEQAWPGGRGA